VDGATERERQIAAFTFALGWDDGRNADRLEEADVVLAGVSRTAKTPLCLYLAGLGIRAANVPLVPEVPPPKALFALPRGKLIGLTVSPERLRLIRLKRLEVMGIKNDRGYATMERVCQELEFAREVMRKARCPVVDLTDTAVEEAAAAILRHLKLR
jgi:regulator of PEP synthase PpsR (kinase-PPPase family)